MSRRSKQSSTNLVHHLNACLAIVHVGVNPGDIKLWSKLVEGAEKEIMKTMLENAGGGECYEK